MFHHAAAIPLLTASASSAKLTKPSLPPTRLLPEPEETAGDSVPTAFGVICTGNFGLQSLRMQ